MPGGPRQNAYHVTERLAVLSMALEYILATGPGLARQRPILLSEVCGRHRNERSAWLLLWHRDFTYHGSSGEKRDRKVVQGSRTGMTKIAGSTAAGERITQC